MTKIRLRQDKSCKRLNNTEAHLLLSLSMMSTELIERNGLLTKLEEWGVKTNTVEHPEVFTVEQALPHVSSLEGMFAKNLFLRDKKKKLYLFCAPHNADVKLNDLSKLVGAPGGFRFADESVLYEKLGLKQGSVTIFGLINDRNNDVKLIIDERLIDDTYPMLYFHPMVNSASTGITPSDLKIFLEKTNHTPQLVKISS